MYTDRLVSLKSALCAFVWIVWIRLRLLGKEFVVNIHVMPLWWNIFKRFSFCGKISWIYGSWFSSEQQNKLYKIFYTNIVWWKGKQKWPRTPKLLLESKTELKQLLLFLFSFLFGICLWNGTGSSRDFAIRNCAHTSPSLGSPAASARVYHSGHGWNL